MDPDTAFLNILRGHLVAEHAAALSDWLANFGFAPQETLVPAECAAFIARHCLKHYPLTDRETIRVRADKTGLWTARTEGPWKPLAIWSDLAIIKD